MIFVILSKFDDPKHAMLEAKKVFFEEEFPTLSEVNDDGEESQTDDGEENQNDDGEESQTLEQLPPARCNNCCNHTIIVEDNKLRNAKAWYKNMEGGLEDVYRCPICRDCLKCKESDKTEVISLREEQEQHQIEESVSLDFENKRVLVHLPKRGEETQFLSSNRNIASKVLANNCKKARNDPKKKEDAAKAFSKLFSNNHAILVKDLPTEVRKAFENKEVQHYLPWRLVYKEESLSSPVRSVYDASTNTPRRGDGSGGRCLNDLLCKGVVNTLNLLKMIIRFCISKRALSGDIQQFYCQCRLVPQDLNLMRFLHCPDLDPNNVQEAVFQCLIFGLKSCTGQTENAKRKLADHNERKFPGAANLLSEGTYVDDLGESKETDEEIEKLRNETDEVLGQVGMKVKDWNYSGKKPSEISSSDGVSISVGGFGWVPETDSIFVKIPRLHFGTKRRGRLDDNTDFFHPTERGSEKQHLEELDKFVPEILTRRICASKAASVFDIRGLLAPIMTTVKVLMSQTVKATAGESWDSPIPTELRNKWLEAFLRVEECRNLGYQRAVMPDNAVSRDLRLICLGDAAEQMTMVGVWGGFPLKDGSFSCSLIIGRSFLSANTTIPRLELEAQMAVANLGLFVENSLKNWPVTRIQGSDSTIALSWINSEKIRLSIFHRNRVVAVRRSVNLDNVYHVKTENMAADVGTRPEKVRSDDVAPGSKWINGVPWMKLPLKEAVENEDIKPIADLKISKEEEKEYEEGVIFEKIPECLTRGHAVNIQRIEEIEKRVQFSDYILPPVNVHWQKYIRIMTNVFKFITKCRRAALARRISKTDQNIQRELSFEDLLEAEKQDLFTGTFLANPISQSPNFLNDQDKAIVLNSRKTSNMSDVRTLEFEAKCERILATYLLRKATAEARKFLSKSWIEKHSVLKDEILYSKNRILEGMEFKMTSGLDNINLDPLKINIKTPIIDRFSPLAYLITLNVHRNVSKHRGVELTYRMLLERVFIYHGHSLVKEITAECVKCRIMRKKFIEVETGAVGEHSLTIAPPMYSCQADLFGPIQVYAPGHHRDTRGRPPKEAKVWGMVFCCPVTRLVSALVVERKDTSAIADGLTRLAVNFGLPRYLMIDQDSAIMKALTELEVNMKDLQQNLFTQRGIIFSTCPVKGHNYSGQCERAIKTVQELMVRHEVGKKKLHATGLQTLLDLISNEINSLPLGFSYHTDENSTSSLRIITPNFFKLGRNNDRTISGPVRLPNDGGELVKNVQDLYKAIFKTWSETYVPKMMYRPTKFKNGSENDELREGNVVLFQKTDDNLGTTEWTLGIIDEIIPSRDGKPRRAIVKYQNPSEYDVSNNQVRITQRLTDRAIRSLVKIYDIHDYIIEEDLAQIADRLTEVVPVDTDVNLAHHPVCLSVNTEYHSNNLVCGLLLMSSVFSGQSGVEQSPGSPQERYQSATRDDIPHHGEGDCHSGWPADDLPGVRVWRFESSERNLSDIVKFVKTTNVIVNTED